MPTSRLIDINTAAITYRTKCLMALDKRLYRNCIGAILSLNAELPEDDGDKKYRIVIDTEEYNQRIRQNYQIVCSCGKEYEYGSVQFFDIAIPKIKQTLFGKTSRTVWICSKCKKENDLSASKIIENSLQKPFYLRVVPEPPENNHGLLSQLNFHNDMVDWVWTCLNSLEDGFTRFRDDNWNKSDEYSDDPDIDTSIEEAAS